MIQAGQENWRLSSKLVVVLVFTVYNPELDEWDGKWSDVADALVLGW